MSQRRFSSLTLFLIVLGALALGYGFFSYRRTDETLTDRRPALHVGTNVGYQPFIFKDESGKIIGLDADVIAALGKRLNRRIVWHDMAFEALLIGLQRGKVDLIIGGISLTPSRKKQLPFIQYYGDTIKQVAFFGPVLRPELKEIKTIDQLKALDNLTIATQAGTIFEDIVSALPNVTVKGFGDLAEITLDVRYNKGTIGLLDVDFVQALKKQFPAWDSAQVMLGEDQQIDGFGIGVQSRESELYTNVSREIAALKKEGVIKEIASRWQ